SCKLIRKKRWNSIANKLNLIRLSTCEDEIVRERLQPSTLSQGKVAILKRMQEFRTCSSGDRLRGFIRMQATDSCRCSASPFCRHPIHNPSESTSSVALVMKFLR